MPAAKPEEGLAATRLQLEALVGAVSQFLGDHGWFILLGCLLVFWARQLIGPWLREQANQRAIRDAQRKERVEVLDPDMRRVRERQQAEALRKATEAAKQGKAM